MRYLRDTEREVNAINDCQVIILTKVIIATLNASTGKLFIVTTQHKHKSRDIKIVSEKIMKYHNHKTADKPMAPRGRATQSSRDTRKTH